MLKQLFKYDVIILWAVPPCHKLSEFPSKGCNKYKNANSSPNTSISSFRSASYDPPRFLCLVGCKNCYGKWYFLIFFSVFKTSSWVPPDPCQKMSASGQHPFPLPSSNVRLWLIPPSPLVGWRHNWMVPYVNGLKILYVYKHFIRQHYLGNNFQNLGACLHYFFVSIVCCNNNDEFKTLE